METWVPHSTLYLFTCLLKLIFLFLQTERSVWRWWWGHILISWIFFKLGPSYFVSKSYFYKYLNEIKFCLSLSTDEFFGLFWSVMVWVLQFCTISACFPGKPQSLFTITHYWTFFRKRKLYSIPCGMANFHARLSIRIRQTSLQKKMLEGKRTFMQCWWKCKLVQPLWKIVWGFLTKLKIIGVVNIQYSLQMMCCGIVHLKPV